MVLTNLWKNCWTWSEVVRSLTLGSTGGRIWLSLPGLLVMGKAPWPPGRLLFKVVAVEVALTWLLNDVFAYVWNSRIKTSVTQKWRASYKQVSKCSYFSSKYNSNKKNKKKSHHYNLSKITSLLFMDLSIVFPVDTDLSLWSGGQHLHCLVPLGLHHVL